MYAREETPLQTAQPQNTRTAGSSCKRLITFRILGLMIVGVGLVGAISFGILFFSSVDLPKKQDVSQELSFRSFEFSSDTYRSQTIQSYQDWTGEFSEEGTAKSSPSGPYNALQCKEKKRCDIKIVRYFREIKAIDRQDIEHTIPASVLDDESFTLEFSDGWDRYYQDCRTGKVVTTVKCNEDWCDNLSLGCSTPKGWVIDTASISAEGQCSSLSHERDCECPDNRVIVGMECHHNFCGTVVLRCADVYVIDTDNCNPNPCGNGDCFDKWGEHHICDCHPGYAGELKCTEINECNPNPCLQGAQCIDNVNDYECKCPDGYEGKNCQITSCTIFDNGVTTSQYLIHEGNREHVTNPERAHAVPGDVLEMKCAGMFTLMDDQTFELLERSQNATCYPDVCAATEDGIGFFVPNVQDFTVLDEAECCWRCGQHPDCRFWTFVKTNSKCYLKSSNEERRPDNDMISGSLSTQGGGGWDKSVDVSCVLPAADIQFSGRSIVSHFSSDKQYQVFDAAVKKLEFDFDGTVIYEDILSNKVTGSWTTSLMLTDQPGMKEYLQGATFYQMGYSLHGDGDDNTAWTQPGTTHCGCEQPAELAAENTFLSHHPGCFELIEKISLILKERAQNVWTSTGDTYIKNNQGGETYGSEPVVLMKYDSSGGLTRYGYVKFQIPCPIREKVQYILKLHIIYLNKQIDIYLGTDETFSEFSLNWDTMPSSEPTALCTGLGESAGWVFCDVTSKIVEDYTCNEDIYFVIKCNERTSAEITSIASRENENESLWPRIEAIVCVFEHVPKQCEDLEHQIGITSGLACEQACCADPDCEVFQFFGDNGSDDPCWMGVSDKCTLEYFEPTHSGRKNTTNPGLENAYSVRRNTADDNIGDDFTIDIQKSEFQVESKSFTRGLVEQCAKPSDWCTHVGSTVSYEDCDGDGTLDIICTDDLGRFGVALSTEECQDNNWPSGHALCGDAVRLPETKNEDVPTKTKNEAIAEDEKGKEYCRLAVRWGPNMQSSNDMLFVYEGVHNARPFYSDDKEGFYLFYDPPYWVIGPTLGDSINFISGRVESNAVSGQDIFGTWEVYNSETDSHEPTPSLVVGCIPADPDASWVYRGFRTFFLTDNTNGKCSEKCREFYPAELYDDLFVSTSGAGCICSIFEPSEIPVLSDNCKTECPGDTSLYPSTCGGKSDDDSKLIADVYRANTVSNAGFLPEYSYPGVGDQTAQHQLALSGAPRDFEVTQKRGGILELKFMDSSTCEDRFEYHQTGSIYEGWNNLLDFDLELVTRQQCGFEYTVQIPESVGPFEDPARQFLAATKSYEFLLRMNTANKNAESYVQTSVVSYIFTAFWESVLTGVVLTRGQNPVFNVTIQVYMPGGEKLDPVLTDMSGTYEIWLHGHFPENEQIFRVEPSLEMHEVAHEFECGSFGKCTTIDHALQMNTKLSDLQLQAQTLDFVDVTIVDIKGTVYVREPPPASDIRCPEADVRICIHYIHPERVLDEKSDCVITVDDGQYTLQIPVMTATVEITAERVGVEFSHNFMTEDQSESILFEDYLFEKGIVEQNFYDVTSRKITASVYGGTPNCKVNILDWKLAAVPENCQTMEYATYYDSGTEIWLGAQEYTLMFLGEEAVPGMEGSTLYDQEMEFSIDDIYTYFEFYQPLVNLTDIDPLSVPDFAFEYHLPATISVSNIEDEAILMGCEGSRDFLSLQHGETYDITISVSEVYSKDPDFNSFCNDAPGTLDIFGLPQRGEDPPPGCSDPATGFRCQLDISYNKNISKSEVPFQITPTSPSLTSKFLAFDFVTAIESDDFENINAERYVESIFVMGTRKLEPGTQVPLPEHIPLLIVREPPGDGSYSFLSRGSELSVNIAVSSESGDLYDFAYYLGGGISKEVEAGFGIYDKIFKIEWDSGVPVEGSIDHLRSYAESATLNLVIEEEYTTPGGGGSWFGVETTEISKTMTDMFLTPGFNLEVSEAQIFDLLKNTETGECTRDETRSYTWSLPDDLVDYEEGQAIAANIFSWYSEYHIANYKIPELERMISTHGDDCPASCMTEPDCDIEMLGDQCYDEDCLSDCPTKLLVLQDSLLGWNDTLKNNQNLKDTALPISAAERLTKDDKIKSYADATHPHFAKESNSDNQNVGAGRSDNSIPAPTSGGGVLLPNFATFYDRVNNIASHHYPATFSNKNNELPSVPGDVHMMTFSGGGSAYTYSYTSSESEDYESNTEDSTTVGGGFSTDYQMVVIPGVFIHASMKHLGSDSATSDVTKTTEASGGVTTSFTLSDDDIGDDFTIDILEDENGWLYFKTAGGRSSCPHEFNTTARQIFTLSLNLTSGDSNDVYDLAPDEVVHWDLIVSNESPTFDAYNMNLEVWSDNEGLIVFVNGLPFIDAYGVNIDASTSYEVHVTAQRPVGVVNDFYVQFKLSSECEPLYAQYVDCNAHYISVCPEARFAETDPWVLAEPTEEYDEEFLKITAVNDLYRTNPWGPTSGYIYEEVVNCDVVGSDSPFDSLGHGEYVLVTCSVDCLQTPGDVIGCPKDGGFVHDDSSICTAAIASDVMNDFGEFLLTKTTDEAEYDECTSNGISTIIGETSRSSFIFDALPEDKLEIFARHRTLSPFGTMAWDPAIDFNFAHFTMNRNGRTTYIWNPSPNLDGDFELQLVTKCTSGYATDRAESTTWIGNIDRSPPKVVPFPEPQDMVYERGDEISFQFNEAIVCDFSENHSESKACWKESPTSECSPIQHSVFCPEQGKDGKVHFLIDRIEDYVGDYIEISVLKIQDLHMMENQLPDPYTFLVANSTNMLLSLESPSLMLLSNFHKVDLFSTLPSKNIRELFYSDDHSKASLGDSLVAVISFQLADALPESDYLPEFVDCSLTYSIGFGREEDLEEQQCSIAFRSGEETVHKWEKSGVSERTFTSALSCAYDEYIKFTFRSLAPKSESSSPCMWLNTQMEIEHKLPSHEHYKQELSKILDIIPDNLQAKESQLSVDLLSKSNEEQAHKKVFEIVQSENDERTFRDIIVALEGALQNPAYRTLYPLSSRSRIQYELTSEPKVCGFEDLSAPLIAFDKSEMSTQNLRVIVNADARYKRLEFSFQDAPDESAQFVYEAGRKPIPSGFWTPYNLDICSSEFELKLPWSHLREHDVLGVGSLDENSLVYEITLNVESWERDKFGVDYVVAVHSLKFRVILENPVVDVEISASESIQLEATPQARIGEGLHIDFFVNQLSINGEIWSISNVLQQQYDIRSGLDISLANTHQGRRQNNEPNGFFEVEIISKGCEFVGEAFDLEFVNEADQVEIIGVIVSSTSLCAKVVGSPCLAVPSVENSKDISHCRNTEHGKQCELICQPGYVPSAELTCVDGKWGDEALCVLKYFLTKPAPFLSTWSECSKYSSDDGASNAHLAVIQSDQENQEINRLCRTTESQRCFIGVVPVISDRVPSLEWIDGSELLNQGFQKWKNPANIVKTETAYISSPTGIWGQTLEHSNLPAVCQIGKCIPSPAEAFLTADIPTNLQVPACADSPPLTPEVFATNGCDVWQVPVETHVKTSENPNNYTIYNTWTLTLTRAREARKQVNVGKFYAEYLWQVTDVIDEPPRFTTELVDVSMSCEDYSDIPPDVEAIDDCDEMPSIQFSQTKSSDECPFVVYREWIASDGFGQITKLQQGIRVGF